MKLRWDKTDLQSYYLSTGASLRPVLENVDRVTELFCKGEIDDATGAVDEIIILQYYKRAKHSNYSLYVPVCRKIISNFGGTKNLQR